MHKKSKVFLVVCVIALTGILCFQFLNGKEPQRISVREGFFFDQGEKTVNLMMEYGRNRKTREIAGLWYAAPSPDDAKSCMELMGSDFSGNFIAAGGRLADSGGDHIYLQGCFSITGAEAEISLRKKEDVYLIESIRAL